MFHIYQSYYFIIISIY